MNGLKRKFSAVPVENDTRILFEQKTIVEKYGALYQYWNWDGIIHAESFIFSNDDVSGLSDEELEQMVRKSPMVKQGSAMTLNRSTEFTFCNFHFE